MGILEAGTKAPDFCLHDTTHISRCLKEALEKDLVLLVFFKNSCPTCQLILPFMERLHQGYGKAGLQIWGISQDSFDDTVKFGQDYKATFHLMPDEKGYRISNLYQIDTVPTLFFVDADSEIIFNSIGFVKEELQQLSEKIAFKLGVLPLELFSADEEIPALKPG